ncbi:MAG: carbamoyltransferase HypF [Brevinematia bacterium]
MVRSYVEVKGIVEGVGFRPFVYRVANELGLSGWVRNDSSGVYIEVEGTEEQIIKFVDILKKDYPKASEIFSIDCRYIEPRGDSGFKIEKSSYSEEKLPVIPPDIAICEKCKEELFCEDNKRFLYPFINCTDCGPRFSIIEDVPYDRVNTTMRDFEMCLFCKEEYEDVLNRRFHAQPVACFYCGPHLALLDSSLNNVFGNYPADENDRREYTKMVINEVAKLILEGNIIAIKGIGGFQLICRADDDNVVIRLRERKRREQKPFALMFKDLDHIKEYCYVREEEVKLLTSYISPIVLLKRKTEVGISKLVSPKNPFIGCMLPYSPLHVLIMDKVEVPIVCTSGNLSDEPICIDNEEAFSRLRDIADYFLVHNRRIVRHVDDSVVKVTPYGNQIVIRRARGFVPKPIIVSRDLPAILAVGGHLKNTIAISKKNYIILSQHIGDLETFESTKAFYRAIDDFLKFYEVKPSYVISDLHPDYISTQFAEEFSNKYSIPLIKVQHHYAHILSVMVENGIIEDNVIGVAWDGTGYGTDGSIWGSEFIVVNNNGFERVFHFLPIPLVGGEKAIKENYRIGMALLLSSSLHEECEKIFGQEKFFENIVKLYEKGIYVESSGAGRLFDGVSSIIGISSYSSFEGQSAMELEFALYNSDVSDDYYEFDFEGDIIDWTKIILGIVEDLKRGSDKARISLKFHNTMGMIIVEGVLRIFERTNIKKVALSGGVFQNSYLIDFCLTKLKEQGFEVFYNKQVPPNDGGISLGQIGYVMKEVL